MMETGELPHNELLQQVLNERLKHPRYDTYDVVSVLGIYWEEGGKEYREESKKLLDFLKDKFGYKDCKGFAIPSENSHLELDIFVNQSIVQINRQLKQHQSGLLIIHYGGHGDEDADKAKRQQRRSVWAAFAEGGPRVKWYEIQPNLNRTTADVFLILDCCFAAQGMRGQLSSDDEIARAEDEKENYHGSGKVIAVLAACGMNGYTYKPGADSFTTAFIEECKRMLKSDSSVLISELAHRLSNRDIGIQTPSVIDLPVLDNPSEFTIRLRHIGPENLCPKPLSSSLVFIADFPEFPTEEFDARSKRLGHYLSSNLPSFLRNPRVSIIRVMDSIQVSSEILQSIEARDQSVLAPIIQSTKADITQAWEGVNEIMRTNVDENHLADPESWRERALDLLKQLEKANEHFLECVADNVELERPEWQSHLYSTMPRRSEVLAPLLLKRIIRNPNAIRNNDCMQEPGGRRELQEVKFYSSSMTSDDIEESVRRVEQLSSVLSSASDLNFRSLPFLSWTHDKDNCKFILKFEIPSKYKPETWVSLFEVIKSSPRKKIPRPTLEERLAMAFQLSKAVAQWHQAGWVHQSINSHDIFFFYPVGEERLDYSNPYLGGFEYARPSLAPSLGSKVADINRDVYRHPDRQGSSRKGHRKKHDLYSLGVVLSEIGLWMLAVVTGNPQKSRDVEVKVMENALLSVTRERLGFYAGSIYNNATKRCLENDFGVSLDDESESNLDQAFRLLVMDQLAGGIQSCT